MSWYSSESKKNPLLNISNPEVVSPLQLITTWNGLFEFSSIL